MRAILSLTLALAAAVSSCARDASSVDRREQMVGVVASFYPLAFVAERVGGDRATVTNLTPPGVEPHDLELTPDDLESIATADVVIDVGGGLPALGRGSRRGRGIGHHDRCPGGRPTAARRAGSWRGPPRVARSGARRDARRSCRLGVRRADPAGAAGSPIGPRRFGPSSRRSTASSARGSRRAGRGC